MEYTLYMTFVGANGENCTMSISGVKEQLNQEEASALMDTIIQKNIFTTKNGTLASKYSAQLVKREVSKFEVV